MTRAIWYIDKGRLFGKVIYIFFCFYAMAVAECFSLSIAYGAALYISLSALYRTLRYRTAYGTRQAFKWALAVFFTLCTVYVLILYPFLYPRAHSMEAIVIIVLPFFQRGAENLLLRRKKRPFPRRALAAAVLPPKLALVAVTAALARAAGGAAVWLVVAAALGMALALARQWNARAAGHTRPAARLYDVRQIRSARLYDGMVIASGAALNIFAFAYALYSLLSRKDTFFYSFFTVFAAISVMYGVMSLGTQRFSRSSLVRRIGKNAAFALGTGIAIFAAYVLRENWFAGGFAGTAQLALLFVGLMLQMTAALGLREDIALVIRLYHKDVDGAALEQRAQRLEHWTALISEAVFLIVLAALLSDPLFAGADVGGYIAFAPQIGGSVVLIPTAFLLAALICSLKQPLTKKYARRLKTYARIREKGRDNPEMEKRLKSVLIKKYKKRVGVHIIRAFIKPVMFHTVAGQENVAALPGIFVFNHREVYGPIAAVVFLPYDMRPWVLDSMLDKKRIMQHMYDGTFVRYTWLPVFLRLLLARLLSPLVVWALCSFEPIPVHRGAVRSVIRTFELSVECLLSGDSLLIFPENPEERYTQTGQVSDFYRGFAHLGRLYHKRTRGCVTFYPVYASRFARVLRIGEGVTYEPAGGRKEEERIVQTLEARMRALCQRDES